MSQVKTQNEDVINNSDNNIIKNAESSDQVIKRKNVVEKQLLNILVHLYEKKFL